MKKMKKMIAAVLAIVMIMSVTITASAGSIFDTIGNAFSTVAHGFETVGYMVANTAEYLCTSSSFDEAYSGTSKAMDKVADSAVKTKDSAIKIGTDAADMVVGIGKTAVGTVAAAGCGLYELGERVITGDSDYSLTSSCYDMMKKGYKQADNGLVKDIAMIACTATGAGAIATAGIAAADLAKTGVEYAVGYVDGDKAIENVIDNGILLATCGAGAAANKATSTIVKTVVPTTVSAAGNITKDIIINKEDRSVFDIVLEDTARAIGTTAFNKAVAKVTGAGSAQQANDNEAAIDDAASVSEASTDASSNSDASTDAGSYSDTSFDSSSSGDVSFDTVTIYE